MAEIIGIKDFNRAIAELKKDVAKRVVKSALRAAAKPIITTAKANAKELKTPHPYRTKGLMRDRMVATNSRIASRKGLIGLFIKPRRAKGMPKGRKSPFDPYYYRFVITGFYAVGRRRVKGGRFTRKANLESQARSGNIRFIKGDDFIGEAFRSTKGAALSGFEQTMKKRIDAANRRK